MSAFTFILVQLPESPPSSAQTCSCQSLLHPPHTDVQLPESPPSSAQTCSCQSYLHPPHTDVQLPESPPSSAHWRAAVRVISILRTLMCSCQSHHHPPHTDVRLPVTSILRTMTCSWQRIPCSAHWRAAARVTSILHSLTSSCQSHSKIPLAFKATWIPFIHINLDLLWNRSYLLSISASFLAIRCHSSHAPKLARHSTDHSIRPLTFVTFHSSPFLFLTVSSCVSPRISHALHFQHSHSCSLSMSPCNTVRPVIPSRTNLLAPRSNSLISYALYLFFVPHRCG